jgi:hypothetical protein
MNTLKFESVKATWLHPELNIGRDPGYRKQLYFHLGEEKIEALVGFLSYDVTASESCQDWIDTIRIAAIHPTFLVESSANACFIRVTREDGVRIVNEYTDEVTELGLVDMKIILEKWLEFLENGEPIEFSWETPVQKFVFSEEFNSYIPAPE